MDSSHTACARPAPQRITPLCFSLCVTQRMQSQTHQTRHHQQSTDQCFLGTQAVFMTAYVWVGGTCCVVTRAANTFSQPTISLLVGQTDVMTSQEVRSKIRQNILLSHMPDAALTILFIQAACVCDARSGVCVCARMHSAGSHSPDGLKQLFYQQTWPDASLRETNRLMVAAGG